MDARTREESRREVAQSRSKPVKPQRIYFPADGLGECVEVEPHRPLELVIETTDAEGNVVPWLCDEWWIQVQSVCRDRTVTVVILPTPNALFDEVVRHQLEMVRRIAPRWVIMGYIRAADVVKGPDGDAWLVLPFDEIRIYEDLTHPDKQHTRVIRQRVTQMANLPRYPGMRCPQVRVIHALPGPFTAPPSGGLTPPAAPNQPKLPDRLPDRNALEST